MTIIDRGLTPAGEIAEPPNRDEIEAVYRDQRSWLFHFFRRQTGDSHEAQSLAHETILRFMRVAPSTTIGTPRAYLRRIAVNLIRDRAKIARRHGSSRHFEFEDHRIAGPSLEQQLEARDLLRLVEKALLQLKPRTREIFMAVRVDGMSYAEVHERTGLSFKIIQKEMARALVRINRVTAED